MSTDARSRLCPEHRSDSIPSGPCVACAQARRIDELEGEVERIDELEQMVERLTEHIAALEADRTTDPEGTIHECPPLPDGGER